MSQILLPFLVFKLVYAFALLWLPGLNIFSFHIVWYVYALFKQCHVLAQDFHIHCLHRNFYCSVFRLNSIAIEIGLMFIYTSDTAWLEKTSWTFIFAFILLALLTRNNLYLKLIFILRRLLFFRFWVGILLKQRSFWSFWFHFQK